jgi:branched-chain amino acid transport system substrate-binding protein
MIAGLLLGAFLGCDSAQKPIKVGELLPLTGEVASYGRSAHEGYQLATQEWNDRGGILGRRIELVLGDDKGDPAEGLNVLTRLMERDRITALLGATLSKVAFVAAPIAQAAEIPMVNPTSSEPGLTEIGDYIFRVCFTDKTQGEAGAACAITRLRARRAACIFDTGNVFPADLAAIFREKFTQLGGKVVAFEGHASGTSNFKPHLAKVLQSHPDLLYIPDFYQDALLIVREARAMGFKGALMGGDGWDSPQFARMGGADLDGALFTTNFSKDGERPAVEDFVRKFRVRNHKDPDEFAAMAYDAGNILFDAIRRAGSTDGPAVKAALVRTDFPGVSGQIRFDSGRNPVRGAVITEIKGGRMIYRGEIRP